MAKKDLPSKKALTPDLEVEVPPDGVKVTSKVKVKAPKQKDGKTVYYTIGEGAELGMLADPDGFAPGRFVANIILDKDDEIEPPVTMTIEITSEDIQRAAGQAFKLAYHNGNKWMVVKTGIPGNASSASFELSKRGDPHIGLAP
jgi:hypothetical protein